MSLRSRLVDSALIVLATAAVVLMGLSYFQGRRAPATTSGRPPDESYLGKKVLPTTAGSVTARQETPTAGPSCPKLVIFFRSNCPYCEATAPQWARIVQDAGLESLIVVNAEGRDTATSWLSAHNLPEQVLLGANESLELAKRLDVDHVPVTMVTDAHGAVTYAHSGVVNDQMRADIDSALAGASDKKCASGIPAL